MNNASKDRRRLLLQFSEQVRQINRAVINPIIKPLSHEQLAPVVSMVAHARAQYLQTFLAQAEASDGTSVPSDIGELRQARERYEELLAASSALETMIERGYLDVIESSITQMSEAS